MIPEATAAAESAGIQTLRSPYAFPVTVTRLMSALQAHGIKIFSIIDQQVEAASAGVPMPPLTLILFGNPKAGTPLMIAKPMSGLDLPLKVIIWGAADGSVFVSFNTASYIISRHNLPPALAANIAPAEKLIAAALE